MNVALPEAFAYHAEALEKVPAEFSHSVRSRLEMGGTISREAYVQAQGDRAKMRAAVDAALSHCDALVLPTVPVPPQKIGAATVIVGGHEEPLRPMTLRLTQLFNLTGHPAISLPCGDTREGLPCGFQLVGRRQADGRPAAGRAQLRSVRVSTCTFVFPTPVKSDSTRLTNVTMSPPRNASQNPST